MPRPFNPRRIGMMPAYTYYKPQGIPLRTLEQVNLTVDEIEAIRLVDFEGMYHVEAAKKMNISRQTLGRILESAHKKIADALVTGKAISIEGGCFEIADRPRPMPQFQPGRGFGRRHRGGR
ncbi:MAG: DUF134 domain-containing protein [Sedimentisphaerales bacterium]|nr:DUF134 domain-containing protein [Sedimentisphaerales bacterium]